MKSINKIKKLFWCASAFLFLMSFTILFMPMAVKLGEQNRNVVVVTGLVFWCSAIIGYILIVMSNHERKWFIKNKTTNNIKMNCRPGMVTFFANVPAKMSDVMMIVSFLLLIFSNFVDVNNTYIIYVLLFLFVFSLHMHCLFNGRIYKTTKFKRTRRENKL